MCKVRGDFDIWDKKQHRTNISGKNIIHKHILVLARTGLVFAVARRWPGQDLKVILYDLIIPWGGAKSLLERSGSFQSSKCGRQNGGVTPVPS